VETTLQRNAVDGLVVFGQRVTSGFFSVTLLEVIYVLLALTTLALITLILFVLVRMYELRREAELKKKPVLTPSAMPIATIDGVPGAIENPTWKHIRERLLSENPSDWKLAVIEADIYMDRCLDDNGFHGDTTGDKLKQVTPDRLPSIGIAWEVHKIRNRIAHEGANFVLTMPEARRMISYYEIIYTDLHAI
jgi:hypothetical protein